MSEVQTEVIVTRTQMRDSMLITIDEIRVVVLENYKYDALVSPLMRPAVFEAKPMVLFFG